ncbi:NAD(P)/FAD-dependent oxidoreductase [Rhodocyclus tenuis]|uniref:NAD(P)/FAD-dependent oxidoreductase n=1 Tax=Rhodocyclus tenuis TaxID=1066 RepID=UPI001290E6B3|nr:FAD-dependent oxidoreductase [Rhodocyclus tenuis]
MPDGPVRIAILGAGFAALSAARELRRRAPDVSITLTAPRAEFVYLPSLIWVPTGIRRAADLVLPLARFLDDLRIDHFPASVTGLRDGGRTIVTDQGEVSNDALLIATGSRFLNGLPGIENALTLCAGVGAAEEIGARLRQMRGGHLAFGFAGNPKEPTAVRGGPMFELLFGVDTWLRQQGRRQQFTLSFFNPTAEPGKRLGPKAMTLLLNEMSERGISTHLGHKLTAFSDSAISTEGGELPADLILFMPGLSGPAWAANSGLQLSAGGFFLADEFCAVQAGERVFVAGDAGSYPGPDWLPKQAHMADLQARAAAENLLLSLEGQAPRARARPELICIVDSVNAGMLIYRDAKRGWVLPSSRVFHWAKRYFERHYLRVFR